MEIQEYLSSIEDPARRATLQNAFEAALECIDVALAHLPVEERELHISVYEDSELQALASERNRMIRFSTGLIEHYESIQYPEITDVIPGAPAVIGRSWVVDLGFAWSLAHELVHIYRKHDSVEDAISEASALDHSAVSNGKRAALDLDSNSLRKALEHDADLSAAAMIYRYIQRRLGKFVDDLIIRKMALFYLYFGIRALPENDHSASHPAMYERLYEITGKLAQLPEKQSGSYIVGQDLDIHLFRTGELAKTAMDLEKFFLARSGTSELNAYWTKWFGHIERGEHTQRAKDWSKVSPWVQEISGTLADNRRDVFYMQRMEKKVKKAQIKSKRKSQRLARKKSR